jgi:hypothetical protein
MVAVMAVIVVIVMAMIVMLMVFMTLLAALVPMFVAAVVPMFVAAVVPVSVAAVVPMFVAALVPMLLSALVLLMPVTLSVTDVPRLVFLRPYEVHLPVARVILAAMQAPGPCMLGRNVQIERFRNDHIRGGLLDDDRRGVDQRRRRPAIEVYTAIYTRRNHSLNGH